MNSIFYKLKFIAAGFLLGVFFGYLAVFASEALKLGLSPQQQKIALYGFSLLGIIMGLSSALTKKLPSKRKVNNQR